LLPRNKKNAGIDPESRRWRLTLVGSRPEFTSTGQKSSLNRSLSYSNLSHLASWY
jgi:hypothetical protein